MFLALFIGGTAGIDVHQAFASVPLGLAFTCMFAAVAGALVAAPFSMVLTGAFMTQVGALQNHANPDRRRHFVSCHGRRQVSNGQPQEGAAQPSGTLIGVPLGSAVMSRLTQGKRGVR